MRTTAPTVKLYATPTFTYGQVSFVSLTNTTLCLSVPTTVSNTGSGRVYAIAISITVAAWLAVSSKTALAVPGHATRSATYTLCASGFTQPRDACYTGTLDGGLYWGDPNPALGTVNPSPLQYRSFCIPR